MWYVRDKNLKRTISACELIDQKKDEWKTNNAFQMKGLFSRKIQIVTCLQEFAINWILEVLKLISMRFEKPEACKSANRTPFVVHLTAAPYFKMMKWVCTGSILKCLPEVCFTRIYFWFEMVKMNLTEYPYLYKGSYIYLLF